MKKAKRGAILAENIVFIVLNLIFLSIIILFLFRQGSGAIILEQSYAKQIALLLDSAKPVMQINFDMSKAKKLSEKNGINFNDIVKINANVVSVKLSEKSGYSYSFFNDVDVDYYAVDESYIFNINPKNE